MRSISSSVSLASVSADAVVSSAMAAFCWVAASSWFIDDEIERSVVSCSEALWAILATISLAALIWSEMRFSASPASPTRRTPWSTWLEERAISDP
uniref:Uncharacterized protein n=1 Tax=Rhizobium leguminosarum bv. trifolii TaxID=386 RepID=A0A1C9I5S4_RHILT|nr:hypothetical protein [Rhizobium leguminosarum bv. trifolii]